MRVPVIDFAGFAQGAPDLRQNVADAIGAACRDTGFFVLANHGLEARISDAAFDAAAAFFDLPMAEKQKISIDQSPYHRGWYGHGGEVLDARAQPAGDMKEGLKIGRDLPLEHPMVVAQTPLHGPNQWPNQWPKKWPSNQENGDFIGTMQACYAACEALSRQIMQAFALSLGLADDYFAPMLHLPMATLSPLRYPPQTGADIGAGAHTDFGCLTLLLQRDEAGLEIQLPDGSWLALPCTPQQIIVNIGDMMARWTNNLYASTRHRVVNQSGKTRHSMAFFFDPDATADLSPLPGCLADGETPHFPPANCLEHLLMKINASFAYRQETL